jgi:hypothetical protein
LCVEWVASVEYLGICGPTDMILPELSYIPPPLRVRLFLYCTEIP